MLKTIPLPQKINYEIGEDDSDGKVIIESCYPGYGTTLGNAIRRVLLVSLPGAAVVAIKINGAEAVQHEFSTLPYIKEDVLEIILNLKLLRLRVYNDEIVKIKLKKKGEGNVTAKDIKTTSDVEIVNKDLHIAQITDKKGELDMDIFVKQGRGYEPTEEKKSSDFEVGSITVDSLFSPLKNVGLKVENVRVGKMTNWDRIILSIKTDGTITFKQAFKQAVKILIKQFNCLLGQEAFLLEEDIEKKSKKVNKSKKESKDIKNKKKK